jgi:Arc/MetJ-type ribon-helix-helix transcriptional regulator
MRRTNIYLDPDTLRALKMVAANEDASVSDLVRTAIDKFLESRAAGDGSVAQLSTTLLDDVLRRVDERRPADIPQDEIERDVADAVAEARAERAARRSRVAKKL